MSTSLTSSIEKLVTTLELRAIREAAYSKNREAMDSYSEIAETIRHHLRTLEREHGAMKEFIVHSFKKHRGCSSMASLTSKEDFCDCGKDQAGRLLSSLTLNP